MRIRPGASTPRAAFANAHADNSSKWRGSARLLLQTMVDRRRRPEPSRVDSVNDAANDARRGLRRLPRAALGYVVDQACRPEESTGDHSRRDLRPYPPQPPRRLDRCGLGRGRHRPGAGGGCGAEGRQRPPRHGDEPGAAGLHAVPAPDAPRPQRRALAGPRPVRAVVRALQPDAVHPAVPGRVRPGAGRHRVAADLEVARPRATRSSATPRAWRSPPARWARAWPRRSGWRWRRATSAACSTRTPRRATARSTTSST